MLYAKPIKYPVHKSDGTRISVMSRHTLSDGITVDPEISSSQFDLWWPELAPSPKLIGDYYRRGLSWDDFSKRYIEEMGLMSEKIATLAKLAVSSDVTILCVEEDPAACHRSLLNSLCAERTPSTAVHLG
jgi:uncharacterized protein YeaO (DUF488 family)